jgi:uroporphyrinogen-III synthase
VIQPGRARLGALVREIVEQVPARRGLTLPVAGHLLDVRGHAVEVAIGRLRTALGDPRIIQTVMKRGYRLAYEPERAGNLDGSRRY